MNGGKGKGEMLELEGPRTASSISRWVAELVQI
jgi:hypothetical protein